MSTRQRPSAEKKDVYQVVTDRIIAALDQGVVPWRKPWRAVGGTLIRNLLSNRPYRGINQMLLAMSPYTSPYWLTFHQCKERRGTVRKGESSSPVVFWMMRTYKDAATGEEKQMPVLRYYRLFNVEQCDGLTVPEPEPLPPFDPIDQAESIVAGMPNRPAMRWGGDEAAYTPGADVVQLPVREAFTSREEYYSTAFHELVHSTGHRSRLDRPTISTMACRFGSEEYSREELVAELGSAMLCTTAGINSTVSASASYIAGWLSVLREEPRMLVHAAGKAQRGADFILGERATESGETPA